MARLRTLRFAWQDLFTLNYSPDKIANKRVSAVPRNQGTQHRPGKHHYSSGFRMHLITLECRLRRRDREECIQCDRATMLRRAVGPRLSGNYEVVADCSSVQPKLWIGVRLSAPPDRKLIDLVPDRKLINLVSQNKSSLRTEQIVSVPCKHAMISLQCTI